MELPDAMEIEKTLFIDSVIGLGNVTKFLFDYNTGKFDKMCMITMKNEKSAESVYE